MSLAELLAIQPGVTAVIGSGGKTALLRTLGQELAHEHHRVLLCTTTKILPFSDIPTLIAPTEAELRRREEVDLLLCAGTPVPGTGKLTALPISMDRLAQWFTYVLVEADGAAHCPLKAHEAWEPVIPAQAGQTICVVGMSGIGKPIVTAVHRPKRFAQLAGAAVGENVTVERLAKVLRSENLANRYFLNQVDNAAAYPVAEQLAAQLSGPAVLGSLWKGEYRLCSL